MGAKAQDNNPAYIEDEIVEEVNPVGPNHYDPDVKLVKKQGRVANWGASKSKRFTEKASVNPGPGHYGSEAAGSISL